jgi:inner membrane transporter RhtA
MQSKENTTTSVLSSIVILLAAMLFIQTGASLAKQLFPYAGAAGTAALRLFFAALILFAVVRPWKRHINKTSFRYIIYYGASMGFMNLTIYFALERIPLGIAVALEFTGPLAVALFASRKAHDFLWVLLAVAGIILILPGYDTQTALDPVGIIYALLAGICWALYIVFGQKAGAHESSSMITALGMAVAACIVIPIGIADAGVKLLNYSILPAAIGIAILSSALPYYLEMKALKALPAKTFGILMSIEPAIAALSGLIILGEQLTTNQWLAIACVITASTGSATSARKKLAIHEPEI